MFGKNSPLGESSGDESTVIIGSSSSDSFDDTHLSAIIQSREQSDALWLRENVDPLTLAQWLKKHSHVPINILARYLTDDQKQLLYPKQEKVSHKAKHPQPGLPPLATATNKLNQVAILRAMSDTPPLITLSLSAQQKPLPAIKSGASNKKNNYVYK